MIQLNVVCMSAELVKLGRGKSPKSFKDITGEIFGFLKVNKRSPFNDSDGSALWICECSSDLGGCGRLILTKSYRLKIGRVKSCGCHRRSSFVKRNTSHGLSRSPEYGIWENIKQRCLNKNSDVYQHYGARGITICDEWRDDFSKFLADLGPRPHPDMEVDRIDNSIGYSRSNCRWATRSEQMNNTRANVRICHNGVTHTVTEWSRILDIRPTTIRARLKVSDDPNLIFRRIQ